MFGQQDVVGVTVLVLFSWGGVIRGPVVINYKLRQALATVRAGAVDGRDQPESDCERRFLN